MEKQELRDKWGTVVATIEPTFGEKMEVRDKFGQLVGTTETMFSGQMEIRDENGSLKATYDPSLDETKDSSGIFIAKGNLLTTLLFK